MAKNDEVVQVAEVSEKPKTIVAKPKFVKVIPKISDTKFIGGSWIELVKDKEVEVTEDAKRVLKEAGVIYL